MRGIEYIEGLFDKIMGGFTLGSSTDMLEVIEDMSLDNEKVAAINQLLDLKLDILLDELKIQRSK